MAVRAKFKVDEIRRQDYSSYDQETNKRIRYEVQTVKMSPVYGNGDPNHENTKFWKATPHGSLELGTINAEAARQFELGKEYYIDFMPAE